MSKMTKQAASGVMIATVAVLAIATTCVSAIPAMSIMTGSRPAEGFLGRPDVPADTPTPPARWIDTPIDQFNPQDTRTFKMRYWINDTFHVPGGPVFLMINGEAPGDPIWAVESAVVENAKRYNALVVLTEHRFYGASQPFANLTTDGLQYLSSEQALADLATLHEAVTAEFNLTSSNKWICFGGSYSGALSAWFRTKYPHLVIGAISNSSPVLAELDFVEYLEVVTASLGTSKSGSACTSAISAATSKLQTLIKSPSGRAQVAKTFNVCDSAAFQTADDLDIANFMSTVAGSFMGVVQYNRDNRAFEGGRNTNITIDVVCEMMTSASDPLDGYAAVSNMLNGASASNCIDFSYQDMIAQYQNVSLDSDVAGGARQWTYQTCAEFAYFQTTDGPSASQIFGDLISLDYFVDMCTQIYGTKFTKDYVASRVNWTNNHYGAKNIGGTNIFFLNGSIDPWHALSVTSSSSASIRAVLIQGTAHCAPMYPSSPNDLPSLTYAREEVTQQLGIWLQQ